VERGADGVESEGLAGAGRADHHRDGRGAAADGRHGGCLVGAECRPVIDRVDDRLLGDGGVAVRPE
jgi:hypothetical protein